MGRVGLRDNLVTESGRPGRIGQIKKPDTMLKNYLLVALRVIRRNKLYSFINVGCLAIGIAVAMTVMVYVLHEHSYDGWHKNARRIFAVSTTMKYGSTEWP